MYATTGGPQPAVFFQVVFLSSIVRHVLLISPALGAAVRYVFLPCVLRIRCLAFSSLTESS